MAQERWTAVDAYIDDAVRASDEALESVTTAAEAAGLPAIAVSPAQGQFLHILAKAAGARRILELGTLAGYSASGSHAPCRRTVNWSPLRSILRTLRSPETTTNARAWQR